MTSTRSSGGHGARRRRAALAAAAATAALAGVFALSAFHTPLTEIDPPPAVAASEIGTDEVIGIRTFADPGGILIDADVEYGTREDGTLLTLDLCSPRDADGLRAAVVAVHGGSWARGDKANDDWRRVCLWLASEGFVAASVNYRLVPHAVFPAAIDDVALAVEWLRENAAERGVDPARIGAFGGSAGGSLAALLGSRGAGPLDAGARVAAVVELSGPVDLTVLSTPEPAPGSGSAWLRGIVADYLACEPGEECPQAADASAITHVDPSDPPVFIGHADAEIIPLAQAERYLGALTAAGVPVELVTVPGGDHSVGLLDAALRERVAAFLRTHLGAAPASLAGAP